MPKLNEANIKKVVHAIVFGPPKAGKTRLVGELAEHGFTLHFFDLENGIKTLLSSLSPAAKERVIAYQIPDTKDYPIAIETMLKVIKPETHKICWDHGKVACPLCAKSNPLRFDTYAPESLGPTDIMVVDSLTQLSNSAMNNIGKGKTDDWKPEWEHFRNQGALLDRFLSTVQNAPYHIVCITHETGVDIETPTGTKERLVPVAGTKNFSRNTAKYFDEVVYCQVRNLKHEAASSTTYSANALTGSRSDTAIEKQKGTEAGLSLLPIFQSLGISAASKAETVLTNIKNGISK